MKNVPWLAILLIGIGCNVSKKTSFNPAGKYSSGQLQEDFSLLQKILESNHPSLYWYSTPDSLNDYFAATQASLKDSLTEQQFKNKVAWAISKIHCGHTAVRSSKNYSKYFLKKKVKLFPLNLKVWEDNAIVVSNLFRNDTAIKRGDAVTSINGFTTKQILDSLCQFIGTDGYSNNFKYQLISFNFPAYYRNAFGTDSFYRVKYIDDAGRKREAKLKNFEVKADTSLTKQGPPQEGLQKKEFRKLKLLNDRSIQIDTTLNTAFLSVNTFNEGRLNRFFRRNFKSIKDKNIQNVVVDLRLNSGGSVLSCTKLTQYLAQKPFHVADTVVAYTRQFPYKNYIRPWFIYWLSMHITGRRYNDGRIHFRFFENHAFKPKKKNHFDGNIYLLTGGYTFSAATLVTGKLRGQNNVTVVGEETGGGAYGNSSMFLTNIILPNTKLRITLPLYRMVLDASIPKNGRGVLPAVEVKPTSATIRAGIDAKLEKVKELIRTK
jgi:hypothetical protein